MNKDNIEIYNLVLTVKTPVHISSGDLLRKNEYLLDRKNKKLHFIDYDKLFDLLIKRKKMESYEEMILSGNYDIEGLLREIFRLKELERIPYEKISKYSIDLTSLNFNQKRDVHQFIRNMGQPYIPGSSIKGALRTALISSIIRDNHSSKLLNDIKNEFQRFGQEHKYNNNTYKINEELKKIDNFNPKLNQLFKGIKISDSELLKDDDLTIVDKRDINTRGNLPKGAIPLFREALKPGTQIKAKLSIDRSIVGNEVTIEDIEKSIESFYELLQNEIYSKFEKNENESNEELEGSYLILGGGSGLFDKTLVYSIFDYDKARNIIKERLDKKFKKHAHSEADRIVSPRMKKLTTYEDSYVPYGLCEVSIEKDDKAI